MLDATSCKRYKMASVDSPLSCSPSPSLASVLDTEACDSHIDYTNLGPNIRKRLEYAYISAGAEERKRCLKTLASVGGTKERRPYTAMPILEHTTGEDGFQAPYSTTYKKDYYPKKYPITIATRPMSTGLYCIPPESGTQNTHYDKEFSRKVPNPNPMYRTGSASGTRNNKPHPSQEFLVWRYPTNAKPQPRDLQRESLTDAKMNEIHRRLCRSTYQSDFLGMPQGYHIDSIEPPMRNPPSYALDSFQRSIYRTPFQQERLKVATTRYGSNLNKHDHIYGTIPLANGNTTYGSKTTTYDRHYNHNSPSPYSDHAVKNLLHKYGFNGMGMEPVPPSNPPSNGGMYLSSTDSQTIGYKPLVPPATQISNFSPEPLAY